MDFPYEENLNSPLWVIKVHSLLSLVVCSYPEGDDLYRGEARCHGEDLASVCGVIQVLFSLWVRHASRVSANNVEVGSGNHSGPTVPLNLRRNGKAYTVIFNNTHRSRVRG